MRIFASFVYDTESAIKPKLKQVKRCLKTGIILIFIEEKFGNDEENMYK